MTRNRNLEGTFANILPAAIPDRAFGRSRRADAAARRVNARRALAGVLLAASMAAARTAFAASPSLGVLGHLIGDWTITGVTRGRPILSAAQVRDAFGGAFMEMHIKDSSDRSPYEARVFIGEDAQGALVVHWLDATGGETSRTLGTGTIKGDHVTLTFPYPDAEFRDRLDYDHVTDRWRLVIEMGPKGHAQPFCDWSFDRIAGQ